MRVRALTRAVTCSSMPRAASWVCRSETTSSPTTPLALKPLFHMISLPASSALCSTGKEKVKPSAPRASPPHLVRVRVRVRVRDRVGVRARLTLTQP